MVHTRIKIQEDERGSYDIGNLFTESILLVVSNGNEELDGD